MTENQALIARAHALLANVEFGVDGHAYAFQVREGHGGVFLQAHYQERDVYTKVWATQYTRKWVLSPHMTDSEIVQTVFKCCHTSFEHRAREGFLYKGRRIFGPHFDIEDLVGICNDGRENAGGRKPTEGST